MLNIYVEIDNEFYDFIHDFGSFPKRFDLGEAKPKVLENELEIPYRDGVLFPTSWLGDEPRYSARDIKITVKIAATNPEEVYSRISSAMNGKQGKLITSTLPDYYNEGLISIGQLKTSKTAWEFTLNMRAQPYKMKNTITRVFHSFTTASTWTDVIYNERKTVYPILVTNNATPVSGTINNAAVSFSSAGEHQLVIPFKSGKNTISLSGASGQSIEIKFREGKL